MNVRPLAASLMALLGVGCATASAPRPAAPSGVPSLQWISGAWCGPHEGGTFCEAWAPREGALVGAGEMTIHDATVFSEALRIEARGGEVLYLATPQREGTTAFRLTRAAEGEAVFENPAHDFPQRIAYRREGDRMTIVVEGAGRREVFTLSLVASGARGGTVATGSR